MPDWAWTLGGLVIAALMLAPWIANWCLGRRARGRIQTFVAAGQVSTQTRPHEGPVQAQGLCQTSGGGILFFGRYIDVTPRSRIVWTDDESDNGAVTRVSRHGESRC